MTNIIEGYDMNNPDDLYDGYSLIKKITIDWDIETPIDHLISENDHISEEHKPYKLTNTDWCGHIPSLTLEVIPELATAAKAINAFSCNSDEELTNDDKLSIIARLSMKLAIVLDGIHEYYLEQAEKSEPEDPMIEDQYGSDFDNDFIDACDICCGDEADCDICNATDYDGMSRMYGYLKKIFEHRSS